MAIPQITKRRIAKLERNAGVGEQIEITCSITTGSEWDIKFEKLKERYGYRGEKPKGPVIVTRVEKGPDGRERIIMS